ncbi:MAG: SurA N-terminal domain-containing protein [Alphaproteobacteria bacterium]|nr:SurA N-terminal domain-containing protein [Alphaproteobacteria bacterium]
MLQAIRTRAGGIVVKGLFALLIISFGYWGIYTRSPYGDSKSPDAVVATVGDQSIRAEDLETALQPTLERLRAQFGGSIDPQQAKQLGIVDTVLEQLVDRSLLQQEVRRLHLEVSDQVIRSVISGDPNFKGADGRFDKSLFTQVLAMNHLTEDQFVARMRRDIPASDVIHVLTAAAQVPAPVVAALYRYRNEKRIAEIVSLPVSEAGDVGQPSDPDLASFYDTHQDLFRTPEFRGFTLASLSPADVEHTVEIPEGKLRQEYEERKDEFESPERRDVEQILAPSKEKADQAAAALGEGKEWNEVATTVAGMDPDTIDLGLLKREELPHQLADIAFDLPVNQPSAPVETPLGWHILRVTKIEPAATQSFEDAKPKLMAELQHEDAVDQVYKVANQVDDALAAGGTLVDVAAKLGLKTTVVAAADVGGRDPDGKPVALPVTATDVLKAAFAAGENETTRVAETQDNAIFVLHLDKVMPPQVKPLAEVKDKAIAAWQAEKRRDKVEQQAKDLAAAVKPDATLAGVAAEKGLTATTSAPLARRPGRDTTVSSALLGKLFQAKQGEIVTAVDPTGAYVAQLKEIQEPEAVPEGAAAELSHQLSNAAQLDLAQEFTAALRKRYPVDIHHDAVDRLF